MLVMKPSSMDQLPATARIREVDPIQQVKERMQFLGDRDRLLMELAFKHRLSRRQIGAAMGLSPGTVSRSLRRVMNRLHDPVVASLCDPKCPLPEEYRQIGLRHFLHRQPVRDLARMQKLGGVQIRGIIEYIRGWQKGLTTRGRQ